MQFRNNKFARPAAVALFLLLLALVPVIPGFNSGYYLGILTLAFYMATYAMNWDLLFGYVGVVNFGPTFLVGLGAYAASLCNVYLGWNVGLSIVAGVLAAVIGGLLLAAPALRLEGPYFGLVTLVSVLLLEQAITITAGTSGGEIGLALNDVLSVNGPVNFYYAFALMVVVLMVLWLIVRSPLGLIMEALGQDPAVTATMGFNVTKYKVLAFVVSAFFSGLAGAMTAFYLGTVTPGTVVALSVAVQIIIMTIVGGRRTIFGSILGAILIVIAGALLLPIGQLSQALVAVLALLVLLLTPGGIMGVFTKKS